MLRGRPRLIGCVVLCLLGAWAAVPGAQVAPRLPGPAFPAVVDLSERGKPAEALALLDSRPEDAVGTDVATARVLLRARLLAAAGRPAEAASAWEAVASGEPSLGQFARRNAFEQDLKAGNLAGARTAFEALAPAGRDEAELRLMLAAEYRARKAWDAASAEYGRVLAIERNSARRDAALLGMAALSEQQGDVGAAMSALARARVEYFDSATYVKARAAEQRLVRSGARPPAPLPCDDAVTQASRLRQAARYREALALLEPCRAPTVPAVDRTAAEAEAITNLYLARDDAEARARIAAFLRAAPGSRLTARVRLTEFRLAVREGQTDRARTLGTSLWRQGAPGLTASERRGAGRLLGAHLLCIGKLDESIRIFTELSRPGPARADRIDTLWRAAVGLLRAGRASQARDTLRQALALRPGRDTTPLLTYWLGVAELALGNRAQGERVLQSLAETSPSSYYGMRAIERLGTAGTRVPEPGEGPTVAPFEVTSAGEANVNYRAAVLLALAGLQGDAAVFARRLVQAVPLDRSLALLAARAAGNASDYRGAYTLVVTSFNWLLQRPLPGTPDDLWALAYPRAYWSAVEPAARSAGVDPLFLLALMRQESGFDPRARSAAGALGLFQLMPDKARQLAARTGVTAADEEALFDPVTNARLAAVLVADLLRQFAGAPAPVAASFNAGEDLAATWWDAASKHTEDLFVDSIPYNETRRYVREVLANYTTYRRLYR